MLIALGLVLLTQVGVEVPAMLTPEPWVYPPGSLPTPGALLQRALPGFLVGSGVALLICGVRRLWERSGAFGLVVGALVATLLMVPHGGLAPSCAQLPLGGVLAAGLGVGTACLVRERGIVSIVLGAVLLGLLLVSVGSEALRTTTARRAFAQARAAVLGLGQPRLYVATRDLVHPRVGVWFLRSLRPPHVPAPIDLFQVEPGSAEEQWLAYLGYPGLLLARGRITVIAPQPPAGSRPAAADWRITRDEQGLPRVEVGAAAGPFTLRAVTPFGAVAELVRAQAGVVAFTPGSTAHRLAGEYSRHERGGIAMLILVEAEHGGAWSHAVRR